MRASEVRDLSDQELALRERELQEKLFHLRLRRGTNQLESAGVVMHTRRDIARIKTIQSERARTKSAG